MNTMKTTMTKSLMMMRNFIISRNQVTSYRSLVKNPPALRWPRYQWTQRDSVEDSRSTCSRMNLLQDSMGVKRGWLPMSSRRGERSTTGSNTTYNYRRTRGNGGFSFARAHLKTGSNPLFLVRITESVWTAWSTSVGSLESSS